MKAKFIATTIATLSLSFLGANIARSQSDSVNAITVWTNPDGSKGTVRVTFFREPIDGKLGVYPDYYNGRLVGKYTDDAFEGYWVQDRGSIRCQRNIDGSPYYGRVRFENKPGSDDEFIGKWSYCDRSPSYNWVGKVE